MQHHFSRRSMIAASLSALAIAKTSGLASVSAQRSGSAGTDEGMFESSRYGDVVTWDENRMWMLPTLSGSGEFAGEEWDKVTLGLHPEVTVALAVVTFQHLPFGSLEEIAASYPEDYWGEEIRHKFHNRGAVVTDDALGFFYTEDDTQGTGAHYCGYLEFTPPPTPDGPWATLQLSANITFEGYDFDVLAANGDAFEVNGNPAFQAWTFDDVLDAFAEEMNAAGV